MVRVAITFVFALLVSASAWAGNWNSSSSSSTQEKLETQNPIAALSGFGVNSTALWSGASKTNPTYYYDWLAHYESLSKHGIKHVVLVSCADWIIKLSCKKPFQNMKGIIRGTKLLLDNTDLHVVVQLKAYKQKKIGGQPISSLNTMLEKDDAVAASFVDTWREIASQLRDYSAFRLSFNLLNEPEFQMPKPSQTKRDRWLSIAEQTTSAIRSVSPDRTVIIEGIAKSLFSNRNSKGKYKYKSPDELLVPIGFNNIIYAFHNYEPEEFLQQAKYRYGSFGRAYTKKYASWVAKDARRAIKWANKHKVPLMLTETGCIGYLKGKEGPKTNEDCGKFAADIQNNYIENGVGVSWWSLEKGKTIYNRTCPKDCWMPSPYLIPNKAIFEGFNLKPK
jgi:hypothetical protein